MTSMSIISEEDVNKILVSLASWSLNKGLEYHPFKIGWYNECVGKAFTLPYNEDILAFVIVSTPHMFENLFLPFILAGGIETAKRDPLDVSISQHLDQYKQLNRNYDIDIIHDFDLHPTRRPKILVQTAAHVAGAAYYYQRSDVKNDRWGDKKINGVCIHPEWGGWFAMRGVLIFKNLICTDISKKPALDCVPTDEKRIELLERFNFNWKDWSFRDIIGPKLKYSSLQQLYFETKPIDRSKILKEWLAKHSLDFMYINRCCGNL